MDINIKTTNFDADKKLIDFVKTKVNKLDKYFDGIIRSEIILNFDKSKKKFTDNKEVKVILEVPGSDLFAEKGAVTFEEAVDTVIDALEKQIKKHKGKLRQ
ncbi:MAG: ribosome-associated translation inhibitor RaiA [Bacteroidales bacterium]|nr:ribosome-associated translation inhibitor RaiA [Bacteroidales bacterium]NOZ33965.1 ribosome-associated translation inhibitor RaiA [Chlorobiota bacterium]